jgi:Lrp/AsnC family leucine-responsive transcriptional regulator
VTAPLDSPNALSSSSADKSALPPFDMGSLLQDPVVPIEIDPIDRQLLDLLYTDSRISQRSLAAKVGMSAPAVAERIARMERAQVIKRHTIEVDWAALGYGMLIVIPIRVTSIGNVARIISELRAIPELTELILLTGTYDMIARFRIKDSAHLQRLLLERVWHVEGLQRVETMLSLGLFSEESTLVRNLVDDPSS